MRLQMTINILKSTPKKQYPSPSRRGIGRKSGEFATQELLVVRLEANAASGMNRGFKQLLDSLENHLDLVIVFAVLALKRFDLVGKVLVCCHNFTKFDEGTHDGDVDGNCTLAFQYRREHCNTLLGEHVGQEPAKTATGWYHKLRYQEAGFLASELKQESASGSV